MFVDMASSQVSKGSGIRRNTELANHAYDGCVLDLERAPTQHPRGRLLSLCNVVWVALLVARIAFGILRSSTPFVSMFLAILALLPAALTAWFILSTFRDTSASGVFLLTQFLLGAIPLVCLAVSIEIVLIGANMISVLQFMPQSVYETIDSLTNGLAGKGEHAIAEASTDLANELLSRIPFWGIVVLVVFFSYCVAGTVEESGKWVFARRYLQIRRDGEPAISCKGILASAGMVALGLATTENIEYVLGMQRAERSGFPVGLARFALMRGVLAFPVHVGLQIYIAVTVAQEEILNDDVKVMPSVLSAIVFHGTFDAFSLAFALLFWTRRTARWTKFVVPTVHFLFVALLAILVHSRYCALLDREQAIVATDIV